MPVEAHSSVSRQAKEKMLVVIEKEDIQINKTGGEIIKSSTNFMSLSSKGAPENK